MRSIGKAAGLALLGCTTFMATQAQALPERAAADPQQLLAQLSRNAPAGVLQARSPATGAFTMLRAPRGVLMQDDAGAAAADRAHFFLSVYGPLFGIADARTSLALLRVTRDAAGGEHVHLSQVQDGLPVFGARLVVHMDKRGITGVSGAAVPGTAGVAAQARLRAPVATLREAALAASGKANNGARLQAGEGALMLYRDGLLQGRPGATHLAWVVTVSGGSAAHPVREQVFVDAASGAVLNRIDLTHRALFRKIYLPSYDPANEDANVVRAEGDPPFLPVPIPVIGNPVDNLYDFAGSVYSTFFNLFGRDSYDGQGAVMHSVYLVNEQCPNAYWNSTATNYCPGFDGDDVVAHEWGHAVTEYTHGLIYEWQSGALNESYSDIYGETVDLHNGRDGLGGDANDAPFPEGVRWTIFEDIGTTLLDPLPGGPIVESILSRDMWNPDRLGSPGKVSSENYVCDTGDGGGVHTNSGVPNHAYALAVDGGEFNGVTVRGIGFVKAMHVWYSAAADYQVPSTNFAQHADALDAACTALTGAELYGFDGVLSGERISADDCAQVAAAALAVELRTPPACEFEPLLAPEAATPALCEDGLFVNPVLDESWDRATLPPGWTVAANPVGAGFGDIAWRLAGHLPAGRRGRAAYIENRTGGTCTGDGDYTGSNTLDSPEFQVRDDASRVAFTHYVATETGFDGGNLKISVNGGDFELVPEAAYAFNPPNAVLNEAAALPVPDPTGVIDGNNTNPLAGQPAWAGTDGGSVRGSWGTTVVDLATLAGNGDEVRLRWEFGQDGCTGREGWFIDRVQAFSCTVEAPNTIPLALLLIESVNGLAVTLDGSGSLDRDAGDSVVTYHFAFDDGTPAVTQSSPRLVHTFGAPGRYRVMLSVRDSHGLESYASARTIDLRRSDANSAPLAALAASRERGRAPHAVTFDASGSTDPDAGDTVRHYRFDFGDGSAAVVQRGTRVRHSYATAGSYTARVTAYDSRGLGSAPASVVIRVTEPR